MVVFKAQSLKGNQNVTYIFFDLGVMHTMLGIMAADIFLTTDVDFVNKGAASEMFVGLEMLKYHDCFLRPEMHYWQNMTKNSSAEVDYFISKGGKVLPIEVKASTQGSMQSLWVFLRKKNLHNAIRTSLENFDSFDYYDPDADFAQRHVDIIPLYALSNLLNDM